MRRVRRFIAVLLLLFMMALIAAPALADCVTNANGTGGLDYYCTGVSPTIQGTGGSDTIINEGTIITYIWSGGFSLNSAQIDTITNNGTVGDGNSDDGLWGGPGNDTITNNGVVNGGTDVAYNGFNGAIFGDASEGFGDSDLIIHNGTANGNIHGDYSAGGSDTITINGTVNGGVYGEGPESVLLGRAGNDTVVLTDNAIVTAIINGMNGSDRLVFDFSTNDADVYIQFLDDISNADPASGSLSFEGQAFTWVNFEVLENSVTLNGIAPSISSSAPPAGTVGVTYSHTFTATGSPAPTYSLSGASLPAGLTFNGTTISGQPQAAGTSGVITVTASNGVLPNATQNFTITINGVAPSITSSAPPAGTVGVTYSHTFTATGSPAPTYSLSGAPLPAGLTFNGTTISGQPESAGVSGTITVTASNGVLPNATQNFTITINGIPPTITSSLPPVGTVDVNYSHTFTATGSPAPTFSLSGTLPAGLTFNGTTISGQPESAGVSGTITVTASNGVLPNATQNFTITINGIPPSISSSAPPVGTVGVTYSHTFTATGSPAPTFSLTGAALPAGLTFNGTIISGQPESAGVSGTITVTASNGVLPNATQNFTITINGIAPSISSSAPPVGTVGVNYSHTFTATGSPAPTFSLSGAALPAGLTFNGTIISGQPESAGVSGTITVTASNGVLPNATQNFTITINGVPPSITSSAPPAGTVGVTYSHTFTATGSPAPTFSLSGAALPDGLTFNGTTISGQPQAAGTSGVITVTASNGYLPNATQNFTITINGVAPSITSSLPPVGTVGVNYSHTFTATGSPAPTFSLSGAALPDGLTFNGTIISGQPESAGVSGTITVTASNGYLPNATQNFTITINDDVPPAITSGLPPAGTVSVNYSHTYTATGSPAPTFSLSGAPLPAGLTFNGTTISGKPLVGGMTATITVTASNGVSPNATQNFTIIINSAAASAPSRGFYKSSSVNLTWGSLSWAARYEVQVSYNSTFTSLVFPTHTTPNADTLNWPVTPLTDGVYYWRVRALPTVGAAGAWSAAQSFTVDAP